MPTEEKALDGVADTSRIYEVGYHLLPTIAPEQVADRAAEIKAQIEKVKGAIISEGEPKETALAYEISKMVAGQKIKARKAYFGWVKFESEAEAALAVQKALEKNEDILRFLLVKTVRENTMIDKRLLASEKEEGDTAPVAPKEAHEAEEKTVKPKAKTEAEAPKAAKSAPSKKEKVVVSDEELDKSIEGLLG